MSVIRDVAGHVEEPLRERFPEVFVERRIFQKLRDRFAHALAKLVVGHGGSGNADHRETGRQPPFPGQAIERGHQLAFGEIAVGAENHDRRTEVSCD